MGTLAAALGRILKRAHPHTLRAVPAAKAVLRVKFALLMQLERRGETVTAGPPALPRPERDEEHFHLLPVGEKPVREPEEPAFALALVVIDPAPAAAYESYSWDDMRAFIAVAVAGVVAEDVRRGGR